jgi:polyhydroxybutyrate depolymerase
VASWAGRNGCGPDGVVSVTTPGVRRIEYPECENDSEVVLVILEGGGHQWPGGKPIPEWLAGPWSEAVRATDLMWAFFREHSLQDPHTPDP